MAPSITETVPIRTQPLPSKLNTDAGYNKEDLSGYARTYTHETEINGTQKQPPASFPNYLPVWDNETSQ